MGAAVLMMYPLVSFLFILAVHYVADFLAQTRWMADNKADQEDALRWHVAVYGAILCLGASWWFESVTLGMAYAFVNGLLHFMVDSVTAKVTKWLFAAKRVRAAFNVIGFDQLLHQVCLGATLIALIRFQ